MMDPSEMIEVTEEQFQSDFDNYMEQIESNGTHYLIRRADGTAVVAAPITEELEPLLDIMPELDYDDKVPGEPSF
jgi:hypothetical protein